MVNREGEALQDPDFIYFTHLSLATIWEIQFKNSTAIDDDLKWKITAISKTNTWHKGMK